MSAEFRSVTGRAYQPFVPVAQNTEQARPKRQAAGESPAGDTILRLEPEAARGSKRRMSSAGSAKEDFPRSGFQAMDGRPLYVLHLRHPELEPSEPALLWSYG